MQFLGPRVPNFHPFCSSDSCFQDFAHFMIFPLTPMLKFQSAAKFLKLGQSRSCRYTLFLTQGGEIELIFALRAAISEIRADFQKLPYLAMKLGHCISAKICLAIGQSATSCTYMYTLFLPQWVEIEFIFALRAEVSEIQPISKIAIFGHETYLL